MEEEKGEHVDGNEHIARVGTTTGHEECGAVVPSFSPSLFPSLSRSI